MGLINVAVAGITGWVGQDVARAVRESEDLRLRSGVARSAAGQDAGSVIAGENWSVPIYGTIEEAVGGIDVLVDYTSHTAVGDHILRAVERGHAQEPRPLDGDVDLLLAGGGQEVLLAVPFRRDPGEGVSEYAHIDPRAGRQLVRTRTPDENSTVEAGPL